MKRYFLLFNTAMFLFTCASPVFAQILTKESYTVGIISENPEEDDHQFEDRVKREIQVLLESRYEIEIKEKYSGPSIENLDAALSGFLTDPDVDIIVGIGALTSGRISRLEVFPKPCIAGIIIDNDIQAVPVTPQQTSGVSNFTYIQSPFSIARDLTTLKRLIDYDKLAIMGNPVIQTNLPALGEIFDQRLSSLDAEWEYIGVEPDPGQTLAKIPSDVDAVYLLPIFYDYSLDQLKTLMDGVSAKGLPLFALLSQDNIEAGAYAAYDSENNLSKIPRRIALNIYKILEGQNAGDLPVNIPTYSENLIINMLTAHKAGIFPDWDLMADAVLLNLDHKVDTTNTLNLREAVFEGLKNNVGLKAIEYDPLIRQEDIDLAWAEYFPQADASSTFLIKDETSAANTFGAQGQLNWLASGTINQLVYSEPAFANIAIQQLLKKSDEAAVHQEKLDVVLDVSSAYLNILQAKSLLEVQQQNVQLTRDNLDIAKAKEAVGYTGATDINRWDTELALSNIDLNEAVATLSKAEFRLNQLLNRPIDEEIVLEDVRLDIGQLLFISDARTLGLIQNHGDLDRFADFMVNEGFSRLPELQQIDYGLAVQERLLKSNKRSWYLPSVALSGQVDYIIDKWKVPESDLPIPTPENKPAWSIGLGVQYPISQGGKRRHNVQQTELNISQIKEQRSDLENLLELQVRSSIADASASYSRVNLSIEAAEAARKNFDIVQDSYSRGLVDIITLIDAQNAALNTELSAVNAIYQFVIDFLVIERSVGMYYFLATENDRKAYFDRLSSFLETN